VGGVAVVVGTSRTLSTPLTMGTVNCCMAILDRSEASKLRHSMISSPWNGVPSAR
jgi:hypothetical protein